jgi:phosphate transport system permease protein
MFLRRLLDKAFTSMSGLSVILMSTALVLVLGPILWRGASAVSFHATVEFRRMQLLEFHRGDGAVVRAEVAEARAARQPVYDILDRFGRGILIEELENHAKDTCRQFDAQLLNRVESERLSAEDRRRLGRKAKKLRNCLLEAYQTTDRNEALRVLAEVLESPDRQDLKGTVAEEFFRLAAEYKQIVQTVELSRRQTYAEELRKVSDALILLLGPRARDSAPDLAQFQYGATRWDEARKHLDTLLWTETWVEVEPGKPLAKQRRRRQEVFEGTTLAALFPLVEQGLERMLHPRRTFYWQYFIDDSTPGHFFGGVGPEALGTLMLTVLAMLLAVPVGVTTAAYLVECTRESTPLRVLRTCINTLAGVPSIVFGLFGLAFFVLWLLPKFGLGRGSSVLAGALTLAVLVLPIIIRTSEEAIRAVPPSYKEASLALGAGGVRTFLAVTLPAAMPGVLTGIILAMSRAAGETAPILFTAAVAVGPWPGSVFKPCRALSYASYDIAVGDRLAAKVPHNQFGMILALVLLVLILNVAAILIRWRISRKLRGG